MTFIDNSDHLYRFKSVRINSQNEPSFRFRCVHRSEGCGAELYGTNPKKLQVKEGYQHKEEAEDENFAVSMRAVVIESWDGCFKSEIEKARRSHNKEYTKQEGQIEELEGRGERRGEERITQSREVQTEAKIVTRADVLHGMKDKKIR